MLVESSLTDTLNRFAGRNLKSIMDLRKLREKNCLNAFTCYVKDWKRQDPSTVKREGDVFSYTTKRGNIKRFKSVSNAQDATFKVQGFYFREVK